MSDPKVDMSGNTLYVSDIVYGSNTPGVLSGTTLSTRISQQTAVAITAATYAPTAAQSGAVFTLSRAAGSTVTLPAPVAGYTYTFVVGTVTTSNAYKVITNTGTVYLIGSMDFNKAGTITTYAADGSTIVSVNLNGTTTGGATIGDTFVVTCLSATEWAVSGAVTASGTLATPFATS